MKRIIVLLALASLLLFPSLALAAGQIGVYVAPKFIYGYTQLQGLQGDWAGTNEYTGKGNKNDSAYGGALAVGYDFNKKFQVPVRAELEYAIFSKVSGKQKGSLWSYYDSPNGIEGYDTAKQKLGIQTLFLNAYYDFRNSTAFTPYLGTGLGLAFISSKGSYTEEVWETIDDWDNWEFYSNRRSLDSRMLANFAWNLGAGLAYDFTDNFSLDLGYRFAGLGGAKTKRNGSPRSEIKDVYMHQVALGLRFTF